MNQIVRDDTLPEPDLSDLIAETNLAWRRAFPKLLGIAGATVSRIINGADDDLVNELFKRGLQKLRVGLTVKRSSPDPHVGKSWKALHDFSGVRKMFAKIVVDITTDYIRKHQRERPFDEQLDHKAEETNVIFDLEWQWAFELALSKISRPIFRELLIGMYLNGLDTKELMEIHKLPKGTVAGYTSQAKKELQLIILKESELCLILWPKSWKHKNGKK